MVIDAVRSGYTDLSTSQRTVWTFNSEHTASDSYTRLPVSVVRFSPDLTGNSAPAGRSFEIPVMAQTQDRAVDSRTRQLTVEVSYDDGKGWQRAPLRLTRNGWIATVTHPSLAGYVSLRANVRDAAGNSTRQTLMHAYRLATN